jgi:2-iminoacetate synthase ThiH
MANGAVKNEAQHRKLGIVDRVIRTIRDIAFAQHWETISPAEMKYITREYNNAPHKTLSELMGFDISPNMAEGNTALQDELREKIKAK